MTTYNIKISSILDKRDINISYSKESIPKSQSATTYINKQWEKSTEKNPFLFSGDIVNVKQDKSNRKRIKIDTCHSTYKEFFETKKIKFQKKFSKEILTRSLSVGCIIITLDDFLVFGIRSKQLAFESGKVTVVSGMADNFDIINGKQVDVFGCIKREMQEEIGIRSWEIKEISCLGLIENIQHHNINIPFCAKVCITFDKIANRKRDKEFVRITKIKNSQKSIQKALQVMELSDIGKPILEIYLRLFNSINDSRQE